jgi:hypothetical protein
MAVIISLGRDRASKLKKIIFMKTLKMKKKSLNFCYFFKPNGSC